MIKKIGFIGVGHIAHYMLTGFAQTENYFEFILADPDPDKMARISKEFAQKFQCTVTQDSLRHGLTPKGYQPHPDLGYPGNPRRHLRVWRKNIEGKGMPEGLARCFGGRYPKNGGLLPLGR